MLVTTNPISRCLSKQVVPLEAALPLALYEKKVILVEHPLVEGALNVNKQLLKSFEKIVLRSLAFRPFSIMVFDPFGALQHRRSLVTLWETCLIKLFGSQEGEAMLESLRAAEHKLQAFKWGSYKRLLYALRASPESSEVVSSEAYHGDLSFERRILFEYYAAHLILLKLLTDKWRRVLIISGASFKPFDVKVKIFRKFRCDRISQRKFNQFKLNTRARKFFGKDYFYLGYISDCVSLDWQNGAGMPNFRQLARKILAQGEFYVMRREFDCGGEKVNLGGSADLYYTWYSN
jgi:hypothetical protein